MVSFSRAFNAQAGRGLGIDPKTDWSNPGYQTRTVSAPPSSLSAFNSAAAPRSAGTAFSFDSNPSSAAPETPRTTVIGALMPGVNTTVRVQAASALAIDGTKPGALAALPVQQNALQAGLGDIQAVKADLKTQLQQAQREVMKAAQDSGYNPAGLFAGATEISAAELLMDAATGGMNLNGAGSFVTALQKTSMADMVLTDRQGAGGNREQALAEIRDRLIQSSQGPQDTRSAFTMAAAPDAADSKPSQFDWQGYFEQGHTIDNLMNINVDEPNPKLAPELALLNDMEADYERVMVHNLEVKQTLEPLPDADNPAFSRDDLLFAVASVAESVTGLSGARLPQSGLQADSGGIQAVLAKLAPERPVLEPDPRFKMGLPGLAA